MPCILIKDKCNRIERFAAEELAKYLEKVSQDSCSITTCRDIDNTICVGVLPINLDHNTRKLLLYEIENMENDAFFLRSIGNNLIIQGKTPRATLFGVYHYLETLGIRWYFPGKENEYIPRHSEIKTTGYNVNDSPSFSKRGIVIHANNNAFEEWIDFAAKVRLNTISLHSFEGIEELKDFVADRGLDINLEVHLFGKKFCSEKQASAKKEISLVKNLLEKLQEIDDFFFWQKDGKLETCDCKSDKCLSISD